MPSEIAFPPRLFRKCWVLVLCCVVMAGLFDGLIWGSLSALDQTVGWTPAVLVGFLSLAALLRGSLRFSRAFWPAVMVVIAMIAIATYSSDLAILCGLLAMGRMAMVSRNPQPLDWSGEFIQTVGRLAYAWIVLPARPLRDLMLQGKWFGRRILRHRGMALGQAVRSGLMTIWLIRKIVVWSIPVWVALIFLMIFSGANPVLWMLEDQSITRLMRAVMHWLEEVDLARVISWVIIGAGSWMLLRNRIGRPLARRPRVTLGMKAVLSATDSVWIAGEFYRDIVIRSLILLNGLFLLQNGMDLYYLWGGATLPQGMTYAEYAHRGAYPLVGAALLAGAIVTAAFRSGSLTQRSPLARKLVYAWLVQTLILTLSAAWRLCIYINAYSLTYLRLASLVWMGLVMAGLIWIVLRLKLRRRNGWMIRNCIATAMAALFGLSLVNQPRIIANYNVDHCQQLGGQVPLDLDYLYRLGPQALPAEMRLLAMQPAGIDPLRLKKIILRHQIELDEQLSHWRGWTLSDWLLRKELGQWLSADYDDVANLPDADRMSIYD